MLLGMARGVSVLRAHSRSFSSSSPLLQPFRRLHATVGPTATTKCVLAKPYTSIRKDELYTASQDTTLVTSCLNVTSPPSTFHLSTITLARPC